MSRFFRRISLLLSFVLLICIPISFFFTAGLVRFNQQSSEILIVATGAMSFSDQRGAGLAAIYAKDQTTPGHWMGGIDRWPPSGRIYWKYVLLPGYYKLTPVVSTSGSIDRRVLIVPLWLLAALFSLPKTLPMLMRRLRRRIPPGCCKTCGYDLRATPDKCPECGAVPAKAPSA